MSVVKPRLLVNLLDIQFQPIRHRHKQRLTQTQGRAQRAERQCAAFIHQQQAVGVPRQWREMAVGEDQGVCLLLAGVAQAVLGFLGVGGEADGDHQISTAHAAHLLSITTAKAGHQVNPLVSVLQVVNEVVGDGEGAAHADDIDVVGVDDQVDGFFERDVVEFAAQAFDAGAGGVDAFAGEVAVAGWLRLVGDHAADALLVVLHRRGFVGVGGAEQGLHFAEAAEAEALREAHDGGRMHFAFTGDVADAINHDPVALLAHVTGDALELARQGIVFVGDQLQQTLGIDRGAGEGALVVGRQIGAGHGESFWQIDHPVARGLVESLHRPVGLRSRPSA